nr:hypothetical protein [uncultured Desulfobacter sp.]
MVFHGWSKSRVKIWKRQIIKRNEKTILALRRQQKECWGGGLHSGSINYALQSFVKQSGNPAPLQKAFDND